MTLSGRSEADYDVKLVARCAEWERTHAAQAVELRLIAQRKLGMQNDPPPASIRWMILERAYREEVRKLHPKWPSLHDWMRGA